MKKSYQEVTCDSCLLINREKEYGLPDGWISIDIKTSDYSSNHEFHLCRSCWNKGQAPQIKKIPAAIRKYFRWIGLES